MALWDKVKKGANIAAIESQRLAKLGKVKVEQTNLGSKIDKQYAEIGRATVAAWKEGKTDLGIVAEFTATLEGLLEQQATLERELVTIEAEAQAARAELETESVCPSCGGAVDKSVKFCPHCGKATGF